MKRFAIVLVVVAMVVVMLAPVASASSYTTTVNLTGHTCPIGQTVSYIVSVSGGTYAAFWIKGQYDFMQGTWFWKAWYKIPPGPTVYIHTGYYKTSTRSYGLIRNGQGTQALVYCR